MPQDIFCDEAGFSGNNLLDEQQPFFAVGTVAMAPEEARELVKRVAQDFRIDGVELKGRRLLRFARGRKAVTAVLDSLGERALVAVWHKKYSLATKFFEHVFEPVLADQNSIFYNAGFHRFISNVIYLEALADTRGAARTLEAFQGLMRSKDASRVPALFVRHGLEGEASGILRDIETFVVCHHGTIAREVETFLHPDPVYSWVLDLSFSALMALLTEWGERHDALSVIIDESKPLYAHRGVFDVMIDARTKPTLLLRTSREASSLIWRSPSPLPGRMITLAFSSQTCWQAPQPTCFVLLEKIRPENGWSCWPRVSASTACCLARIVWTSAQSGDLSTR